MLTSPMPVVRRTSRSQKSLPLFGAFALVVACSSSEDIDFFEPSGDTPATGGSSGMDTGGVSTGGSTAGSSGTATGGTSAGGTSGDSSGGTGADPAGGTAGDTGGNGGDTGGTGGDTGGTGGDTGGSGTQGGASGSGSGKGGTAPTGGDAGKAGMAGNNTGGVSGAAMGGAGAGGAGMGGAGMGGAGMAGAGAGGAGAGGAGAGGAGAGGGGAGGKSGKCVPTVPSTERCDGVDNNCSGAIDEGTVCPTGCTGATRGGHAYMFCSWENINTGTRNRNWQQASDFCTQRTSALVAIESAEENQFVLDWITKMGLTDSVWMGANDRDTLTPGGREGIWVWGSGVDPVQFWQGAENGSPVGGRYNDWDAGEPNNDNNEDCAAWASDHDYHWDDRACANTYQNLVCETTAAATTN